MGLKTEWARNWIPTVDFLSRVRKRPQRTLTRSLFFWVNLLGATVSWKIMAGFCNSDAPVVVVLSGSMEPGLARGDVVILTRPYPGEEGYQTGDIVVFNQGGHAEIPIIHRIIARHNYEYEGKMDSIYLTKGDNNNVDDRGLYYGKMWLKESEILGQAVATFPRMGMLTIWLNETNWVRVPFLIFLVLGAWWA